MEGALFFNPATFLCVYHWLSVKKTHRYWRTLGVVGERGWCIAIAASSSQSFLYSHHLPKSFRQHGLSLFIKVESSQTGKEREGNEWECNWEVWRQNNHEIQLSNGYCSSKGRYIKYKTETSVSIYGPDYRCINQVCYLAQSAPTTRSWAYQSLRLLYELWIDVWFTHTNSVHLWNNFSEAITSLMWCCWTEDFFCPSQSIKKSICLAATFA